MDESSKLESGTKQSELESKPSKRMAIFNDSDSN